MVLQAAKARFSGRLNEINGCQVDADCMLVRQGYCGGAAAIHTDFLELWNQYLEQEDRRNQGVVCE